MKCITCGKGIQDGIALYSQNEKGVTGIWACLDHDKFVPNLNSASSYLLEFNHEREQINKPALAAELREELLSLMLECRGMARYERDYNLQDKIDQAITKLTNLGESK